MEYLDLFYEWFLKTSRQNQVHIVFGTIIICAFGFICLLVHRANKHEKWVNEHNKKLAIQAQDWMHENRPQPPKRP
ncbi:hypothetical protein UGMREWDR_CDS0048 [Aeromonas phage GomatiRiver_11]|nr:hypothetical protein UGMREWDR_CDS0048 [Aeromonas phage GomatiRiver_11]